VKSGLRTLKWRMFHGFYSWFPTNPTAFQKEIDDYDDDFME
jgi:hypothetical protein